MPKLPEHMVKRGGSFYFRKKVGPRDVRISLGTDFERAKDRLRSLITEDNLFLPRTTIREAADRWVLGYVATARANKKDRRTVERRVQDYLIPAMGHVLMKNLKAEDVRSYRLWLEKKELSPQTVKHILSDLRCFLNWCESAGMIERSPFPRRVMPKVQERPPDRLTEEEVLAVCSLPAPFGPICQFLIETGLRWSEALRAQTSDVQSGVLVVHQTKSGKVRRVPLSPLAQAVLYNRVGLIVPLRSLSYFSREVKDRSGVRRFHVHQLRHTSACRWLERGGSLAALQQLLGHSSVVTTQRYARLSDGYVSEEVARVLAAQ